MQINFLHRPSQTIAQVVLAPQESLLAESGAMMGMTPNVNMQTQSGGFGKGLKRMLAGESFFRNTFTAQGGQGELLLTTPLCGDMMVLEAGATQYVIQQSAYVASAQGVDVKTVSGGLRGMFSGAGLFTLQTQGQGPVLVGSFGAIEPLQVQGEVIVDNGHLVAWDASLKYTLVKSGSGWIGSMLSGEGYVCRFEGHGTLYLQTRNATSYGQEMGALLPPVSN